MTTAAQIITRAFRLFGIIDAAEEPTAADIANCVPVLNDLLRSEHVDGAAQYLMRRVTAQLPAGISGEIYSFTVGVYRSDYLVQEDAVAIKSIWVNDVSPNVNRETRMAPIADVVRTTYPGMITKWHQERQADASVLVTAWQPPRSATQVLIEYGKRLPVIENPNGSTEIYLPPEGIHDATLLFGRRICTSYGRSLEAAGLIAKDAEAVNARWRDWARGQQWLRFVRA